jgi:hypothetical protein
VSNELAASRNRVESAGINLYRRLDKCGRY